MPTHPNQAHMGDLRAYVAAMNSPATPPRFAHLSFDGRGINDRDEYRTRIATFAKGGGNPGDYDPAKEFGPLFAAAPDMLAALENAARDMTAAHVVDTVLHESKHPHAPKLPEPASLAQVRAAIARALGKQP